MTSTNLKPKWWQLYLTFPLLIVLFVLEARLSLTMHEHEAAQIGIVLVVYGLIHFWIKSNARALTLSYDPEDYGKVAVIRIPSYRISTADEPQLPNSEIHGVLGDTFEMNVVDAEFLPQENASKKLNEDWK